MLRLEKLEMTGFKSFLSHTEFLLREGLIAVVGPNGCGKSNIADALNWVMGEQSVKSLRGDRMEDVIFNGTEGLKPIGMAEVSLHLKNGHAEGDDQSLVITRRLFRSGESEYLINGAKSRLRDIQEELARINVGSGLYSIIEQGRVDWAINSRPRERRLLIEEAAGIAVYKARKHQAESKLEATEANLARVNDIVSELERQLGSLRRQAARARRYGRTMEEIARQERILLYHDHARLDRALRETGEREQTARGAESEAAAGLARLEAKWEEERRLLEEQAQLQRQEREGLHGIEREMDRLEREITLADEQTRECESSGRSARERSAELAIKLEQAARETGERRVAREEALRVAGTESAQSESLERTRRELEQRVAALESDMTADRGALLQTVDALSEARNRRRQAQESREALLKRHEVLDRERGDRAGELSGRTASKGSLAAELSRMSEARDKLETELRAAREKAEKLAEALSRQAATREESRHKLHGNEQHLKALEEIETEVVVARDLVSGLVKHEGFAADHLKAPARLEPAIEIYLDRVLQAALVAGYDEAVKGVGSIRRSGKGRAAFLSFQTDPTEDPPALIGIPSQASSDPGLLGRLADLVEIEGPLRAAVGRTLARALVVSDLDAALRLRKVAPFFDYITLEGDILHTSGLIEGGAPRAQGAGILTRRRLKADLMRAIEAGRAHQSELSLLISGLESERAAASAAATQLAESLAGQEREMLAARLKLEALDEEASRLGALIETVDREKGIIQKDVDALSLEGERLAGAVEELELARRSKEAKIAAAQEELGTLRISGARAGEALAALKASATAAGERLEAIEAELARMLDVERDVRARMTQETARAEDLDRRMAEAASRKTSATRQLDQLAARQSSLDSGLREREHDLAERRGDFERLGHQAKEARGHLEASRGQRETITLERERVAADLRHLLAGAAGPSSPQSDSPAIEALVGDLTDQDKSLDPEAIRAELTSLRERRDRMGPVNMLALEEFRELEERYGFLTTQRKDLVDAVASLKETIARINRTSRERFLEAFEQVRAGFGEIFRKLFGGGKADLRLMTSEGIEDVLECGLEIIAQPPGKRLQYATLLSGGEKALTAISLLFAIFKFRPSPFCLLDEVDAPLDEANVIRFNDLLRSMAGNTQFVMITHNRRSMEVADVLYGVTMEEPGVSRTVSVVLEGNPDRVQAVNSIPGMMASRHRGNGRRAGTPAAGGAPEISPESGSLPA